MSMGHEAHHETTSPIADSLGVSTGGNVAQSPASPLEDKKAWQSRLIAMSQPLESDPLVKEMDKTWRGFDKEEVLRLILQTLDEMGYRSVAASLEEASKVELFERNVRVLKRSVLTAEWQEAGRALFRLPLDGLTRQACWFLLMQHNFLEALLDPESALERKIACLRNDLSPSAFDSATTERVHECASLLMYQGTELTAHALRISCLSRSQLFNRLTCLLPPSVVMQPSRLATILSHARLLQVLCCPLHAEPQFSRESLVVPHRCKMPLLPQSCTGCLHAHQKEVWVLAVAPKQPLGTETLIASGAADKSVCVWVLTTNKDSYDKCSSTVQVEGDPSDHSQLWSRWLGAWLEKEGDSAMRLEETQPLSIIERGIVVATCRLAWRNQRLASAAAFLDWDSTGTLLAVGSEAAFIEAWEEGRRIADFCTHSGSLIALQWVPASRQLISIGSDRIMSLITLQQSGFLLTHVVDYEWSLPARPQEGFVLPGSGSIIVFFGDRQAKVFDVVTKKETFWMQGKDLVVSACPSKLCNQILMSTASSPPALKLWDLDERRVVQKYLGHKLGRLMIRPAFGGHSEELVISGGEDAQIYIWHRLWGCLLQQLRGHTAAVNQVVWLQSGGPLCLMSAGDDGVLLLWSASREPQKAPPCLRLTGVFTREVRQELISPASHQTLLLCIPCSDVCAAWESQEITPQALNEGEHADADT